MERYVTERYVRGDLVLLPFPFSAEEGFKVRPALVLASLPYASGTDYLVCIVTTQNAPDPYLLPLSNTDMEEGKLSQLCYLRPTYAYTVAEQQIKRTVGRITPAKLREALQTLTRILTPSP